MKHLVCLHEASVERYYYSDPLVLEADNLDSVEDMMHRLDVMARIEALVAMPA